MPAFQTIHRLYAWLISSWRVCAGAAVLLIFVGHLGVLQHHLISEPHMQGAGDQKEVLNPSQRVGSQALHYHHTSSNPHHADDPTSPSGIPSHDASDHQLLFLLGSLVVIALTHPLFLSWIISWLAESGRPRRHWHPVEETFLIPCFLRGYLPLSSRPPPSAA